MQYQRLSHEGAVSGLAEVNDGHTGRLAPGETLQEPAEQHHAHGSAKRSRDAATAAGAEGDEAQVILGERDLCLGIGEDVSVGVEAERVVPDSRVADEADAT
jgi:hypothetical protein